MLPLLENLEVWSTADGQTTSWTYDSLGNRLTESRYRGSSSLLEVAYYANSNRIKTAGDWKFAYDANGNLIYRGKAGNWNDSLSTFEWSTDSGEIWQYEYDLKNRLIAVKHGEAGTPSVGLVASYAYDMRDLRVSATRAGETSYYQYDLEGSLVYKEEEGRRTRYIQALGQTWAEVRSEGAASATYYHQTDHLGTTELITDEAGGIVWSGSYETFGTLSRSNGALDFDPSYTGKELDEDTGLYYFNARWYDPSLGRFITEDPARDGGNWYAYVGNRPLTYTDPTGLEHAPYDEKKALALQAQVQARINEQKTAAEYIKNEKGSRALVENALRAINPEYIPAVVRWQLDNPEAAARITNLTPEERAYINRPLEWIGTYYEAVSVASGVAGIASLRKAVVYNATSKVPTTPKGPNFVVDPSGQAFPVPKGATGPTPVVNPAGKITGSAFTGGTGGTNGKVNTMRMMDSTPPRGSSPGYPNGNIKYENAAGQGVNPYTGQTIPNSQSHYQIRIPE